MISNRNSLSSQRAALEAACKEEDSPPPAPSPQNVNRGKLDQKLGDDIKIKMEVDDDKSDIKPDIKTEDSEDSHKMGSKWIGADDIKKEKDDGQQLDMNTNVIGREGWDDYKDIKREPKMDEDVKKIKEEAMSPGSSNQSDSQALVKPELKLEPVSTADKKIKTCSEYSLCYFIFIFGPIR